MVEPQLQKGVCMNNSVYLQGCDAALELGDVLQLPHPRPLRRLPVSQDPTSISSEATGSAIKLKIGVVTGRKTACICGVACTS